MSIMRQAKLIATWVCLVAIHLPHSVHCLKSGLKPTTTAQVINSKGYLAEDIFVRVQNSTYIVNLIKVTNPLITKKVNRIPLLFVNGALSSCESYLLLGGNVTSPKDFSRLDASKISEKDLIRKLNDEPSSKSLVYTALNFGHPVWLLNRRSTTQARSYFDGPMNDPLDSKLIPPKDLRFWEFSFDEQAKYDLPEAVDFVLNATRSKQLSIISYSAGGPAVLTALMQRPELANKIHKSLFWASSYQLRPLIFNPVFSILTSVVLPVIGQAPGSFPPDQLQGPLMKALGVLCKDPTIKESLCDLVAGIVYGDGGHQHMLEEISASPRLLDSSSFFELAQILKPISDGSFRFHDHNSITKNMIAYGNYRPPVYDLSKITLRGMYFYYGFQDAISPPATMELVFQGLKVPFKRKQLGDKEIRWNHASFILHQNISKLLILPAIKILQTK